MTSLVRRALVIWITFIPVAIANGVLRELWYGPQVGELAAHQISTAIAVVAFFSLSWALFGDRVSEASTRDLVLIGISWMVCTILFEFGFGHYLDGRSWTLLLHDYDLTQGRVWSLFLLSMLATPVAVRETRGAMHTI